MDFRWRKRRPETVVEGYRDLRLGLAGRHQAANMAVALAALGQLQQVGWNIPEEAIRRGLAALAWPARVEVAARQPAVVLDGAHNAASVAALIETLGASFSPARRLLVFAASQDKDLRGMLRLLLGQFDEVLLTRYLDNPRAMPPEELQAIAGVDRPGVSRLRRSGGRLGRGARPPRRRTWFASRGRSSSRPRWVVSLPPGRFLPKSRWGAE